MSSVNKEINIGESATAPQQVLEQAVERAVEKDVDGQGLEAQSTSKTDDVELEETSIGNSETVVEAHSSLTDYVDVSASRTVVSKETAVDIVDKNFEFPPDYFKVVERSYKIYEIAIGTSAGNPNQYPYRFDLLNGLLYFRKSIVEKLMYAQYIRFNLEVQVKILATNFHYGQLMVVWRPSYSPYLPCAYTETGGVLKVNTYSSSESNAGQYSFTPSHSPYDNIFTASQLEHHIVPITGGASLTLKLPWTLNRQYVPVTRMLYPENHIGFLDIYRLTPTGPAEIDAYTIQLFARMRDIVGFGYRAPVDQCDKSKTIILREYYANDDASTRNVVRVQFPSRYLWQSNHDVRLDEWDWNLHDIPLPDPKSFSAKPWWLKDKLALRNATQQEPDEEPAPEVQPQEEEVLESGEYDRQQKGGALYNMFNATVTTANTVAAWVGDALAYFGLSRPPMRGVPERFVHLAPPVSNSVGPDFCVSNGVNPDSLVLNKKSDHAEQIEIARLGATEVYMGWREFTRTNNHTVGWLYPGRILWFKNFDDSGYKVFYRTPTSMLLEKFALWRGNCKYRLHFSSSSFQVARFEVTIRYDGDTTFQEPQGMVPTQIVEVKGDTTVEGEIPYLYEAPWRSRTESIARIEVKLVSWPVCWKNASPEPIYMSAWVSYPGFQVAMPTSAVDVGIPYGINKFGDGGPSDEPRRAILEEAKEKARLQREPEPCATCDEREEVMESGKLPGVTPSHPPKQYGMNDFFTSLYQLAKRFNPVFGRVVCPLKPNVMVLQKPASTNAGGAIVLSLQPSNSHFAPCFRWVRGSYDLLNTGSYQMVDLLYPDGTYPTTDKTRKALFCVNQGPVTYGKQLYTYAITANHMSRNGQSLIASRSPYHSNYPFVSAPTLSMRTTNRVGKFWWQSMCDAQGEMTNITCADGLAQKNPAMPYMELAYGDDLCYSQWMGCPMGISVADAENGYFPATASSFSNSIVTRSA